MYIYIYIYLSIFILYYLLYIYIYIYIWIKRSGDIKQNPQSGSNFEENFQYVTGI